MIAERITLLWQEIATICHEAKREPEEVKLLAVSKGQSTIKILQAYRSGVFDFGESYVQEALPKLHTLAAIPLTWHFIGPIQRNKAKAIATHFSWVHSVERLAIAEALNRYRPAHLPKLKICIQVNIDAETTKSGLAPCDLANVVQAVSVLPNIELSGFMCIPKPTDDVIAQSHSFIYLRELLLKMNQQFNLNLNTLSMGMSNDFPAAIHAGSTLIRIGRRIFA